MSGGFTITPVANDSGDVVDFDVDGGYQGFRSNEEDIVEYNDGSRHHVMENASIREDGEFDIDEYYTELQNSDPRIPQALDWAADNLPADLIEQYNQAIDSNDLDTVNQVLEYILSNYPSDESFDPDDESLQEEPELTEDDQAVIEAITEQLADQPPLGDYAADEWESYARQAAENGDDPAFVGVATATAAYHSGEVTAQEAIDWVLANYDLKDVARVYQHLSQ